MMPRFESDGSEKYCPITGIDLGKIYFLNLSYDEKSDEFFAYVDDGTPKGDIIFQIDNTKEICDYIETGRMKHIDDVAGLTNFLQEQGFIQATDSVELNQELVY